MSARAQEIIYMGAEVGDASDVELFTVHQAGNPVAATHESWPTSGVIRATEPGARLHLVGYANTEEGKPPIAGIPAIPPSDPIPPDIEGQLTLSGTKASEETVTNADLHTNITKTQFMVFDLTTTLEPSGVVFEQGSTDRGGYVGFVADQLVVRAGDTLLGADLRVDVPDTMRDTTGRLFVELNPTTGTVRAWWLRSDEPTTEYLGEASGTWIGDWANTATGGVGEIVGTANIEGGSASTPTVDDAIIVNTFDHSKTVQFPDHVEGNTLFVVATMHSNGQADAVSTNMPAPWKRVLFFSGDPGSQAPAMFVWQLDATGDDHTGTVKFFGPTRGWHKTIVTMVGSNIGQVTAALGSRTSGYNTSGQVDFPAGSLDSGRVIRILSSSTPVDLDPIPGHVQVAGNFPEHRGTLVATSATITAVDDHEVAASPHTSATISLQGDIVGEGNADYNGAISEARFYAEQPAPDNIDDPGTYGDPGSAAVDPIPAVPLVPGTPDDRWAQDEAGRILESVRVRLAQSRTGAGIWNGTPIAVAPDGSVMYGRPSRPTFDVSTDGIINTRFFGSQTAVGDGTGWATLMADGWAPGVLLEAVTENSDDLFGRCELDVVSLQLRWAQPPRATLLAPVTGGNLATVTPEVGWLIDDDDTQTAYRVKVWTELDPDDDTTNVVFDSGQIVSGATRSHQVTRPLEPACSYVVGLQVIGDLVDGKHMVAPWVTSSIVTPSTPGSLVTPQTVVAAPTESGSMSLVSDPPVGGSSGDWFYIERATQQALDAVNSDPNPLVIDFPSRNGQGWGTALGVSDGTIKGASATFMVEFHGRMSSWPTSSDALGIPDPYLVSNQDSFFVGFGDNGGPVVALADYTSEVLAYYRMSESEVDRLKTVLVPNPQNGFGLRATIHISKVARFEVTVDRGATWTTVSETFNPADNGIGPEWATPRITQTYIGDFFTGVGRQSSLEMSLESLTVTCDGSNEIDIDVGRDTVPGVTEFIDSAGNEWSRLIAPSTVRYDRETRQARALSPFVKATPAATSTVPVGLINIDRNGSDRQKNPFIEWHGTLAGDYTDSTIFVIEEAGNTWLSLGRRADGNMRVEYLYQEVDLDLVNHHVDFPLPAGHETGRIGLRCTRAMYSGGKFVFFASITFDGGTTWTEFHQDLRDEFGTLDGEIVDLTTAATIRISGLGGDPGASTERLIVAETQANESVTLFDIDFGRDVVDENDTDIIDVIGNAWYRPLNATIVDAPNWDGRDLAGEAKVFAPVAGLREALRNSSSLKWIDNNPPQGVGLVYRVRGIQEPHANFEAFSSGEARTAVATVDPVAWRLGSLDGTVRFDLHPSQVQIDRAGRGTIGSGIGDPYHTLSTEPIKSRYLNVTVETFSQAEYQTLMSLITTDLVLTVADVHGNAYYVRRDGHIVDELILAEPTADEPWPVRHAYQVGFNLAEVRPPRLGFGK